MRTVASRLRARRGELDELIFARVRDLAPGAVGLEDPEYVEGLRAAVAAAMEFVLTGLEQGTRSGSRIPSAAVEQARRAALTRVGLDTVLRRYVAGYALLESFVVQEAEHAELPGHGLRDMLADMSLLVDRLITAVSRAYGEQVERPARTVSAASEAVATPRRRRKRAPDRAESGGSEPSLGRVAEIRRERILDAMVDVVAERGFSGTTVKLVIAKAKVSRRRFYDCFDGLDDALVAVMERALEQVGVLASEAFCGKERWLDGMRGALAAVLEFFDSDPQLAWVCFVEALAGGPAVLAHGDRVVGEFRALVIAEIRSEASSVSPLAAEGVLASVMGVVRTRLIADRQEPLIGLLGPLMALTAAPYLDESRVQREIERGDQLARAMLAERASRSIPAKSDSATVSIPAPLLDPRAYRARLCLLYVAEQGRQGLTPSNQQVAAAVGVSHRAQVSRLLSRLVDIGLLVKRAGAPGHANAWSLTLEGERVAQALAEE